MSQTLIINVGVSGAGKTTWSIEYIKKNPRTVRINRDDLRVALKGTLDGYYDQDRGFLNATEDMINKLEEYTLIQALMKGFSVIIDNTNLKPAYINRWTDLLREWNEDEEVKVDLKFKIFPLNDAQVLKKRVNVRDAPLGWDKLDYIDKQLRSLPEIIRLIGGFSDERILNE